MGNKYTTSDNEIIFEHTFNESLDSYYDVIKMFNVLKFSDIYSKGHRSMFNYPIEKLPDTITCIIFGHSFNQYVNLPSNVVFVAFGCCYNYPIVFDPNCVIKRLSFSHYFNQPIILPKKLIHLTLGYEFNQRIVLPETLEVLYTHCKNSEFIVDNLPSALKHLTIGLEVQVELNNLTNSIEQIVLCDSSIGKSTSTIEYLKKHDKRIRFLE